MLLFPDVTVTPGATAVPGFMAGATYCGLRKSDRADLALVLAPYGATVAGVFTQSQVVAAPVIVARERVASGGAAAFIVNAGNANACTGAPGMDATLAICAHYEEALGLATGQVIPASTGVIGVPLPVEKVTGASAALSLALTEGAEGIAALSEAIMTTDTRAKACHVHVTVGEDTYAVCGVAKGSGMIKPNMATTIGLILTDAPLSAAAARSSLSQITGPTFNSVTVDGDTSTNDTLVLMASGTAQAASIEPGTPAHASLTAAIGAVAEYLAREIARDGEGATKLVEVWVRGAASDADAHTVAMTIAESPLVKTALFGNDANWGRVAAAAGRSGVSFDQGDLAITFCTIPVCAHGTAVPFDEDAAFAAMNQPEVTLEVSLGGGSGWARVLTCDLSYDYVRINGEYRT